MIGARVKADVTALSCRSKPFQRERRAKRLRAETCLLSTAIFVLVISTMFVAGALPGMHPSPNLAGSSQTAPIFSQLGSRGLAKSTGVVDVSSLPSPSAGSGKLWSTFQPNPASQAALNSRSSPSILSTTSSSLVAPSGGFDGLNMTQSCQCFPPDPIIAAGPNHVFEMVNLEGAIYNKQGTSVESFTLQSFYNTTSTHRLSDPKVLYDSITGQWFTSFFQYCIQASSL